MADTINSVNEKESVSDIFKRLDDVKRMQKKFMREVSPDPRFRSGNLLATVCEKEDAPYSAKSAAGKTVFFCMKEYSNEEIEQINQDSSDWAVLYRECTTWDPSVYPGMDKTYEDKYFSIGGLLIEDGKAIGKMDEYYNWEKEINCILFEEYNGKPILLSSSFKYGSSDCDSYIDMMYFLVNKKDIEKRETE
jgi:hypothetical protein